MRQIAIIGLAPSHDLAPWDDETWEKWGLPWDSGYWPRYDRLFELHDRAHLDAEHYPHGYLERLESVYVPLYMQEAYFPSATKYPKAEIAALVGDYFTSSVAYMLAMAIYEGVDRIGLWGIDMSEDYNGQRPNFEYLLGFARGRGIDVVIHESSPLLKGPLYGWTNGN